MNAIRLHAPELATVDEVARPDPGSGEVRIRTRLNGLCGTDMMVYSGGFPSAPLPIVLGHEFVGEVDAVGPDVGELGVGERVTARGSWSCGGCPACVRGETATCTARSSLGRSVDGTFAEYLVVPSKILHLVPGHVTDEDAQAFITVATAGKAVTVALEAGPSTVTVVGTGHAGLLMVQLLSRLYGVAPTVLGTRPGRLELAREAGAGATYNVRDATQRTELEELLDRTGISDAVIDATGTGDGLGLAIGSARPKGRVVVYSVNRRPEEVDHLDKVYGRELTLVGSRGGDGHYDRAVRLLADGLVTPSAVTGTPVPLAEAPQLLADAAARRVDEPRALIATGEG